MRGRRLKDGCLDLDEPLAVEVGTDGGDDAGAVEEDGAGVLVGDQIELAPPVAGLHIGEAMVGVGRRSKGLGEDVEALDAQGDLTAATAENGAVDADQVAEIEGCQPLEGVGAEDVEAGVQLDLAAAIDEVEEGGAACAPARGEPPGDAMDVLGLLTGLEVGIGVEDLPAGLDSGKSIWEVLTARLGPQALGL